MRYYDENGELNDYAGTPPIAYQATIHTNAFRNAAEAKTWDVQNEAVTHTVNGDEVTFTYQVRTGALGTQGEILRQNSDYVDNGVLDLSGYTLQETIQPVTGKNGREGLSEAGYGDAWRQRLYLRYCGKRGWHAQPRNARKRRKYDPQHGGAGRR